MKGVSRSTLRRVQKLPLETVSNILWAYYGEFAPWLPKAERPKAKPTGGGVNATR